MIHHQRENIVTQDGEEMISLGFALQLLFKMEMEDYSNLSYHHGTATIDRHNNSETRRKLKNNAKKKNPARQVINGG
jgi:hypothetical protein